MLNSVIAPLNYKMRGALNSVSPQLSAHLLLLLLTMVGNCTMSAEAMSFGIAPDPERPNVIVILADDLGYGDLGCYGQERINTPNLDRMASQGLRFMQAYAGAAVCAPSRCVLMTGFHIGHARVRGNDPYYLPGLSLVESDVTVAEMLKDVGYATGCIGKWGLGDHDGAPAGVPRRQGFDYFFGYLRHGHAHNYYPAFLWRNDEKVELPNVLSKNPIFKGIVAEKKITYSHDLIAEECLKFVSEHKRQPFFLYAAFTIPHTNNEAGDKGMEVPDYGEYAQRNWPDPEKGYAAMISRMDRDIGRLLRLLVELKVDDNTLVIFSSDNGPAREGGHDPDFHDSNGPLRGYKGNLTEGGIRVPLIARWPGRVPAGSTSDLPVHAADVMPTVATICGGKSPAETDGIDFSPTLCGKKQPELWDRFLYWEFNKNGLRQQAARWRDWKAVRDPYDSPLKLYDLSVDPGESSDVAAEHPDIVAKFNDHFKSARADSSDWPVKRPDKRKAAAVATQVQPAS